MRLIRSKQKLLNQAMLKQAYMRMINEHRNANLCLLKIEQFNALMSILNPTQSSHIITTVAKSLEHQLSKQRQFISLESSLDTAPKVADLGNGILAFVSTKIQPQDELNEELNTLCKTTAKAVSNIRARFTALLPLQYYRTCGK